VRRPATGKDKLTWVGGPPTATRRARMAENKEPVVIKKYANRRLYNTASSSYVTLEHLSEMVKQGVDFVVYDAKTNEDITRTVLTQIIFEEESQGQSLLPIQFLRQLISFYGNSMQAFLPSYLELSLASFTQQQERLRGQLTSFTPGAGLAAYEDQIRQNLQLFDRAMKMFSPFAVTAGGKPEEPAPAPAAPPPAKAEPAPDEALAALKKQMAEMQAQIDKLAKG
jgi:polyhydroxyalkanoate synthesis repressor PhaR